VNCVNKIFLCSILHKLGSEEFGTVHFGLWSDGSANPVQVAVKILKSGCSESDRVKFLREAAIMGQFENDYIIQLHGVVTDAQIPMIIFEYIPKGDLQVYLINLKNMHVILVVIILLYAVNIIMQDTS